MQTPWSPPCRPPRYDQNLFLVAFGRFSEPWDATFYLTKPLQGSEWQQIFRWPLEVMWKVLWVVFWALERLSTTSHSFYNIQKGPQSSLLLTSSKTRNVGWAASGLKLKLSKNQKGHFGPQRGCMRWHATSLRVKIALDTSRARCQSCLEQCGLWKLWISWME